VRPLVRNSDFITTGTVRPPNASWRWKPAGSGGRLPSACCHRMALSTVCSTRTRNPVMPWRAGGTPVVIEVSATGVVDGTTVVMAPPAIARSSGTASGWSASAARPRPSSTSRTTARAPATGSGSQSTGRRPSSAGTTLVTFAPP
jgi:hypothetical protein